MGAGLYCITCKHPKSHHNIIKAGRGKCHIRGCACAKYIQPELGGLLMTKRPKDELADELDYIVTHLIITAEDEEKTATSLRVEIARMAEKISILASRIRERHLTKRD